MTTGPSCRSLLRELPRGGAVFLSLLAVITLVGCGGGGSEGEPDRSAAPRPELRLMVAGEEVVVPLEMMDVFLVEDDSYPETFEIRGPGVLLVGAFPLDVHVDYEADLSKLEGHEVVLQSTGGGYGQPQTSKLTLPGGTAQAVIGGWFMVEASTGPQEGVKGDGTISGRISVQVQGEFGTTALSGTFAVPATTWG